MGQSNEDQIIEQDEQEEITPIIHLPVYISGINMLKDRSWKITLETNELAPASLADLVSIKGFGVMAFKAAKMTYEEITELDKMEAELPGGKSESQKMRNILYILWKQDSEGFTDFKDFYAHKMCKFNDSLKAKIEQ